MNISKSSWHYRLYNTYWSGKEYHSVNLCPYMRGVFMGANVVCFITLLFSTMAILFLEPFAIGTMWLLTGVFFPNFFGPDDGIIIYIETGFLIIALIYFIFKGGLKLTTTTIKKIENAPTTNFTALIGAWYKAAHDKVCPLIRLEK